ncbi:integrase family protein [Pseudomonas sp. GM78]|uniref:hypothetical protein n=1 Tax=Pseudomonas sp. GM78 TaxID=1144337 RepID=UPI000270B2A1|nr:hypothetical protein [Pseudomonas sp. GM78]EJN16858.1 integrase family protein [Pseudomonas sp. GM78]
MDNFKRFSRGQFKAEGRDCELWTSIEIDLLPENIREETRLRVRAIKSFLTEGASLLEIEDRYGVHRSTLYRMIERCESIGDDGRAIGFKGAIPHRRVAGVKYKRVKQVTPNSLTEDNGDAGAFEKLLQDHEELRSWVNQLARRYKSRKEGGEPFSVLHVAFLAFCRSLEIPTSDYPFCRKTEGRSALRMYLIKKRKALKGLAEQAYHDSRVRDIVPPTDILEQVEADGHEVDVRLVIEESDRYGQPVRYEILRVWLIVLIDVFSRCVLGYSIALGRNYDQVDLLTAIYNSMQPHTRPPMCIPETAYTDEGGFPSEGEGAWETWSTLKLDNAWAHRAKHVLTVLQDRIGCVAEFGRIHTPNDRPFVERFFLFLIQHFSHRIIGSTGSDSKDAIIQRLSPKSNNPLKLLITLDELTSAVDIVIADYNGRPHSSLQGHSPLDIMKLRRSERSLPGNKLPEKYQHANEFLMVREPIVVKSDSKYGGAYVNFAYLKYRNAEVLRADSCGRNLFIEYARNDISVIRLLDEAGSPMGSLIPPEPWCRHPHSLKLRTELSKAIKDRQFIFERNETVHQALRRSKLSNEGMSRSLATELYKQSGRVSEEPSLECTFDLDNQDAPTARPTRLTKVFTY